MDNAMINNRVRNFRRPLISEEGFTLIEVMISMVILMVGLLMILALFAKGLSATQFAQQDLIAKQKAREQLEAIFSSRNDSRVGWNQIRNAPAGIYLGGFNPLYAVNNQSTDIMGTTFHGTVYDAYITRDASGNFAFVPLNPPGCAGCMGWQRQVEIINTPDVNLRNIIVTVRVTGPRGAKRDYVVHGEIASGQ
jgi:Tfp pilus assembly protein PilV